MIAKTTFNVHDTQKIFGPHKSCHCKPLRSPLPSTTSSSSGYSSERSSLTDVPDSPDSTKLTMTPYKNGNFPSPVVNTPRAFVFPSNVPAVRAVRDPQQRRHSASGNRHQTHHPGLHGRVSKNSIYIEEAKKLVNVWQFDEFFSKFLCSLRSIITMTMYRYLSIVHVQIAHKRCRWAK